MSKIKDFTTRQPLVFVVLLILSSLLIAVLTGLVAGNLFGRYLPHTILANLGLLISSLYIVIMLWRFGWLKPSGVASLGSWKGWLVGFLILIYTVIIFTFPFFGGSSLDIVSKAAGQINITNVFVSAAFEEILFRGAVLFTLVRAWGRSRNGVLKAGIISALLFGVFHAVNIINGDPGEVIRQITLASFEGIWLAAIVLRWGSIWPGVCMHAIKNWVLWTLGLIYIDRQISAVSNALVVVLVLPLVILGIWWIITLNIDQKKENIYSVSI